ncbi:hypothetical protein KEM55_009086 [Ascosphaera atra]|nr:hypothetical protein KEM55_009086 [Ascosphaera atra]
MPPPVPRYSSAGMAGPFAHLQHGHMQQQATQKTAAQQQQQQQHPHHPQAVQAAAAGMPPPAALSGHPAFGPGATAYPNMNPFALNGMGGAAFPAAAAPLGMSEGAGSGLASHAAQLGFVRGAQIQQQQQQAQHTHQQAQQQQQQQQLAQSAQDRLVMEAKNSTKTRIRDVWKHNLEQEMHTIRNLIDKYNYVSMVCGEIAPLSSRW